MNSLDLYIDHLKTEKKQAFASGSGTWIVAVERELDRALGFARAHGLTDRHRDEQGESDWEKQIENLAQALWLEQYADDQLHAASDWQQMTQTRRWHPDALKLFDEAQRMLLEQREGASPVRALEQGR